MVVEIKRKITTNLIFENDYYKYTINQLNLLKWILKIRKSDSESIEYYIRNEIKDKLKLIKENSDGVVAPEDVAELYISSYNEITKAIIKFTEEEVVNWNLIEEENVLNVIKSYAIREDEKDEL